VQTPVGTQAVQAVQFPFDREGGAQEQPPQRGLPHLQHVLELHVLTHAGDDFVDVFARKSQPLQDRICYFCAASSWPKKWIAPVCRSREAVAGLPMSCSSAAQINDGAASAGKCSKIRIRWLYTRPSG